MRFKPRIMPRDGWDILIGVPIGFLLLAITGILPSLLVATAIRAGTGSPIYGLIAEALAYFIMCLAWLLFSVGGATIETNGIRFHRIFGSPRFVSRDIIISIQEATRLDAVLHGWLWPPFPPREATLCLSAKKHFKIEWKNGFCYFPPQDIEQFKHAAEQLMNSAC
jgi:hypothetical protein